MHNTNDLECTGARFVKREMDRFSEMLINESFQSDLVTKTNPPIHAKYARVPAQYKQRHIDLWTSNRAQEIVDASAPTDKWMWNFPVGWCVSEHPTMTLLFIWYMPHSLVIGLDGPVRDAVVAFAKSEQSLYASKLLYTDDEITSFGRHYGKIVYLQNHVTP